MTLCGSITYHVRTEISHKQPAFRITVSSCNIHHQRRVFSFTMRLSMTLTAFGLLVGAPLVYGFIPPQLHTSQSSSLFTRPTETSWAVRQALGSFDPELSAIIEAEEDRQRKGLELIASENFVSKGVREVLGSCLTNKYSEGGVGRRYYGGNEYIDQIETLCMNRALKLYGLDPEVWGVNVQPYSGSPANFAAYTALLQPHDRIMGLDLPSGGHLTHGFQTAKKRVSATSVYFESLPYVVSSETGLIDYDEMEKRAKMFLPKLLIAGGSAYPREWDYKRMREIADSVGALLMVDMAHISGLVAGGVAASPFEYADVVTSTTHKTLRGPRSGVIFAKVQYMDQVNSAVFPSLQGGPHNHQIGALAVALKEASQPEFRDYARAVVANAKALGEGLQRREHSLATGGTDNHLLLWDVRPFGLTGSKVDKVLELASITANKNSLHGDVSAVNPGGIRLGTPALTTRGLTEVDFEHVAEFLHRACAIAQETEAIAQREVEAEFATSNLRKSKKVMLKDFQAVLDNNGETKASIQELKHEVEEFGMKFFMPGRYGVKALIGSTIQPLIQSRHLSWQGLSSKNREMASYDIDSDEEAEQRLGVNAVRPIEGPIISTVNEKTENRYDDVLAEVGLKGKLKHASIIPPSRRVSCYDVFCNRELKQEKIAAVGFDMDYTLAQYQQPAFDKLAFDGAKEKLVEQLGFPEEVLQFEYDHERWTRGLIIDTERGNFLKIDRHKYVRIAYHGMQKMTSADRKHLYSKNFNKVESFSEKSFVNLDTLFQIVDAHLFALLVDLKDRGGHKYLEGMSYADLFRSVRESVDLCHRANGMKDEVAKHPEKYLVYDEHIVSMLRRYRESGIKVFLLTNSFWEHTSNAMNFLYHGRKVDEETSKKNEWTKLFDLCIVGSCKPAFLLDPYLQLFRLNMEDGSLRNTDGIFDINSLGPNGAEEFLMKGNIFQGGNWQHLHKMLGVDSGDEIMYVGDHLYSDVLRSKRTLGWRSVFIMPELEEEIRVFDATLPLRARIERLRRLRDEMGMKAEEIRRKEDMADPNVQRLLREIDEDDALLKHTLTRIVEQWHASFHPFWGAMFNAGYQDSRFAYYVENYACLYTSRASNLGLTSKYRSFRTTMEMLPHDKILTQHDAVLDTSNPW